MSRSELERPGPSVWVWVALAMLFLYRVSSTVVDLDLFHQMALIREWGALGALPREDLYAFTPTVRPFMHHEWGAGAIAYATATRLGGAGILLLRYILAGALALVTVRAALRSGAPHFVAAVLTPVAIILVENGYPPLRAHAYSFLFTAVMLDRCERARVGDAGRLWALVPLFVLWVNIHAGFVLGMVLLAAHGAELAVRRARFTHVALVLVAVIASVGVNPYGLAYYPHVVRSLSVQRGIVSEWSPIWFHGVPVHQQLSYFVAVGIVAYGLAFGRSSARNGTFVVVATAILAGRHYRLLPFFGIVWLMYCPALLSGTVLQETLLRVSNYPRAVASVCAAMAVAAGALLWDTRPLLLRVPNDPLTADAGGPPYFPVGAVAYLRAQQFHGRLLTPFNQGAYVLWKLYPDVRVSLDSRYEAAYEPALVEELSRVYQTGEGLSEVLARYAPDAALVPLHSGLADAEIPLEKVYEDRSFAVYARPESGLRRAKPEPPVANEFP